MNSTLTSTNIPGIEATPFNYASLSKIKFKISPDGRVISAKVEPTARSLEREAKAHYLYPIPSSEKIEAVAPVQEINQTKDVVPTEAKTGLEKFKLFARTRAAKIPKALVDNGTFKFGPNDSRLIKLGLVKGAEFADQPVVEPMKQQVDVTAKIEGPTEVNEAAPTFEAYKEPDKVEEESASLEPVAINNDPPVQEIQAVTVDGTAEEIQNQNQNQNIGKKVEETPMVSNIPAEEPVAVEPEKTSAFKMGRDIPSIVPPINLDENPMAIVEMVNKLINEATEAQKDVEKYKSLFKAAQENNTALTNEVNSLRKENGNLKNIANTAEQDNLRLQNALNASNDEIGKLKHTLKDANETIAKLTNDLTAEQKARQDVERRWQVVVDGIRGVQNKMEDQGKAPYSKAA